VPLASQAGLDAIASGTDPIWCPAGQTTPTPGANGCTPSFTSFDALLSYLAQNEATYQQAGTIYIAQGLYGGGEASIDFNNYGFTTFDNFNLTLQGGWDTTNNSTTGTSQINAPITIGSSLNPWGGSLTINNISINGNSGQSGLTLFTQGNVNLSNVDITNAETGANLTANGDVVVRNSKFNNNATGANIKSGASVSLLNVQANQNTLLGAYLEGTDIAVANSTFSNNGSGSGLNLTGRGLEVVSKPAANQDPNDPLPGVSLFNVVADNNQLFGANILAVGDVAIGGISSFSGHLLIAERVGGYGLQVVTTAGNIALQGVTANNNYLYGASLQGTDVVISDSFFSNTGSGVIDNPVDKMWGYGLKVDSKDTVTLKNIEANNNQHYGANIAAVGDIVIGADTEKMSTFSNNQSVFWDSLWFFYGYGLKAYTSTGNIALDRVEANFNYLWGADLDGLNIDITNSQFNNNVSPVEIFIDDTGLLVNSRGNFVRLDNVEAKENRLIGAKINALGDVFISNSNFSGNRGFTCAWFGCQDGIEAYHGYGLKVETPGLISLNAVTANENHLFGASLSGSTVNVANSTFNSNTTGVANNPPEHGLIILSTGDVTLTNVTASGNRGNGVDATGACTNTVNVNGGTFTNNTGFGLSVVKANLNLTGTQVFSNNSAGNIFTDTTCVVVPSPTSNAITAGTTSGTESLNSNSGDTLTTETETSPVVTISANGLPINTNNIFTGTSLISATSTDNNTTTIRTNPTGNKVEKHKAKVNKNNKETKIRNNRRGYGLRVDVFPKQALIPIKKQVR
jgi:hypothetical protein